jgi:hypothetical protein
MSIPADIKAQIDKMSEGLDWMPVVPEPLDPVKSMEEICKEVAKKQRYEQDIFRKRVALMLKNKGCPTAVVNVPVGYNLTQPIGLQQVGYASPIVTGANCASGTCF